MSEKKFKYLDKGRQIDLSRLLWHTITTYGLSAILEQLIALFEEHKNLRPYELRLIEDLKRTLATYEARYELDPEDEQGMDKGTEDQS